MKSLYFTGGVLFSQAGLLVLVVALVFCLLLCFYPTRLESLFLFSCCTGSRLVMASDYQAELFLGIGEPFGNPFFTFSPF